MGEGRSCSGNDRDLCGELSDAEAVEAVAGTAFRAIEAAIIADKDDGRRPGIIRRRGGYDITPLLHADTDLAAALRKALGEPPPRGIAILADDNRGRPLAVVKRGQFPFLLDFFARLPGSIAEEHHLLTIRELCDKLEEHASRTGGCVHRFDGEQIGANDQRLLDIELARLSPHIRIGVAHADALAVDEEGEEIVGRDDDLRGLDLAFLGQDQAVVAKEDRAFGKVLELGAILGLAPDPLAAVEGEALRFERSACKEKRQNRQGAQLESR